jgi:hypothetical protein
MITPSLLKSYFLPSRPINKNFFCIGHSHLLSVKFFYEQNKNFFSKNEIDFNFLMLLDKDYENYTKRRMGAANDKFDWSLKLNYLIKKHAKDTNFITTFFGGNAHNIMGLVNHPEKFDFYLTGEADEKVLRGARIIPLSMIEANMKMSGGYPETLWCLNAIRKIFSGKIVQVESPPPIPSRSHLLKYAGPFKSQFDKYGAAPKELRYKLWRVHSNLIKQECAKLNIDYLQAPIDMIDENGFLQKKAWNLDTNHANSIYGESIINQLIVLHN